MNEEAVITGICVGARDSAVDGPAHYHGDGTVDCARALAAKAYQDANELLSQVREDGFDSDDQRLVADFLMHWFWEAMAFRYLWRKNVKGGELDVRKASQCLARALELGVE